MLEMNQSIPREGRSLGYHQFFSPTPVMVRNIVLAMIVVPALRDRVHSVEPTRILPRRLSVGADAMNRSFRIDLPDLATIQQPGLVCLTRDLEDADKGFVVFSGRRIALPPVPGGLRAKIVIPLRRDDLQAAGNAVSFGTKSGGYVILDWRIEEVRETQPTIVGQTYDRLCAGGRRETIRAFDGVMAYERKRRPLTPDAVPHWTRRGAVRMTKSDNDPLFLASCYWWYFDKHRDVMEHSYTEYADRVLEICRQGHINCVMLRWSCCMSLAFEQQWQQQCEALIERLHAQSFRQPESSKVRTAHGGRGSCRQQQQSSEGRLASRASPQQ